MYGYNMRYTLRHLYRVVIREWVMRVKHAIQRVRRGWDDKMIWSLDDQLIPMLIEILPSFKDSVGTPVSTDIAPLVGIEYVDFEAAQKEWNGIVDTMIEGFKIDMGLEALNETQQEKADEAWRLFVKFRHTLWT